jgi:hypothetical protein
MMRTIYKRVLSYVQFKPEQPNKNIKINYCYQDHSPAKFRGYRIKITISKSGGLLLYEKMMNKLPGYCHKRVLWPGWVAFYPVNRINDWRAFELQIHYLDT